MGRQGRIILPVWAIALHICREQKYNLHKTETFDIYTLLFHALVAQLDRATDYESVGREFESLQARHKFKGLRLMP